jgi:hypothetical protein
MAFLKSVEALELAKRQTRIDFSTPPIRAVQDFLQPSHGQFVT